MEINTAKIKYFLATFKFMSIKQSDVLLLAKMNKYVFYSIKNVRKNNRFVRAHLTCQDDVVGERRVFVEVGRNDAVVCVHTTRGRQRQLQRYGTAKTDHRRCKAELGKHNAQRIRKIIQK